MIERARDGGGPSLLHVKLNRYYGHFEGDAQTYRDAGRGRPGQGTRWTRSTSSASASSRPRCSSRRTSTGSTRPSSRRSTRCMIDAKAAPLPTEADLMTDVYVSY